MKNDNDYDNKNKYTYATSVIRVNKFERYIFVPKSNYKIKFM